MAWVAAVARKFVMGESITMSWSSKTPSRSSPAETSAHSWTWIARTSTSWCVRSEKIVSVVPYTACAAPPAPFAPASSTRTTRPVSPRCCEPPITLTCEPIVKNLARSSAWKDKGCVSCSCFGRITTVLPSAETSCTTPTRCLRSPSTTRTMSSFANDAFGRLARPAAGEGERGERCAAARRSLCSRRVASYRRPAARRRMSRRGIARAPGARG